MHWQEGFHRRSATIIAETVNRTWGGKGITQYMDDWWPYGDKKLQVDIAERLKQMREISSKQAKELAQNSIVQDAIKKYKLGRRSKNSNRG